MRHEHKQSWFDKQGKQSSRQDALVFYSAPLTMSKFWGVLVVWAGHPLVTTGIARVRRARPRMTMLIKATLPSRTTARRYRK